MNQTATRSVLVVEDSMMVQNMIAQIIRSEGYEVRCANNGVEALEYLRRIPIPSLILLDRMMPYMDAEEFLQERQRDAMLASIPVVVISSYNNDTHEFDVSNTVGYLEKPIDLDTLLNLVKQYCG